jgi:hypothetical protein
VKINWPAILLLVATGVLHVYQFWLTPPSLPMAVTVLFGVFYLGIAIALLFRFGSAIWFARIVPAVGASLALISIAQGQQRALPWVLPFVAVDVVVLWLVWHKRSAK